MAGLRRLGPWLLSCAGSLLTEDTAKVKNPAQAELGRGTLLIFQHSEVEFLQADWVADDVDLRDLSSLDR